MPLKKETQELIKKYALSPNKLLGQNFLVDRLALAKIISAAELSKDDTVLEVGPGLGILTRELAKNAGRVVAVEKDKQLAAIMQNILQEEKINNVEIIAGDILKFSMLFNDKKNNYKFVANIPYYLTSHLIRVFLESDNPPSLMVLMLQKEVAQRICAQPPKMSLLAAATQFYADVKNIAVIPKKSFWPMPKVDSAIIKIIPNNHANAQIDSNDINKFFKLLHAGFSQPRKQLANNLHQVLKTDRTEIEKILGELGFKNSVRAQELAVGDWSKLTAYLKNEL
ncbi:MAG: Ribosomal RNA small subunit methyltransferase A [Parcubacteria group bacterium GW2011_GWA2_42_11]|nr:MAG: Ribosomal RNA small subunit methyltransferase A [Parcubacteria group bacterium GW2011_GWA2_42_11]